LPFFIPFPLYLVFRAFTHPFSIAMAPKKKARTTQQVGISTETESA